MVYILIIFTRWLDIYPYHPLTRPKQGKFPPKRICLSQTHLSFPNAFCVPQRILRSPTHFASPNAFCVPQRNCRPPMQLSFNAFCVDQGILRWPTHFSLAKAFCVGQSILPWPKHFALANAFVVHSDYKRAAAPSIENIHSHLFLRNGRL